MGYTPRKIEFNPPRSYEQTERKAPTRKTKRANPSREKQARKLWHELIEKRELQELRKMEG